MKTYLPVILFFMTSMLTGERVSGMSNIFFCLRGLKSFLLCFWNQKTSKLKAWKQLWILQFNFQHRNATSLWPAHPSQNPVHGGFGLERTWLLPTSSLWSETSTNSLLVISSKPISTYFFQSKCHRWIFEQNLPFLFFPLRTPVRRLRPVRVHYIRYNHMKTQWFGQKNFSNFT